MGLNMKATMAAAVVLFSMNAWSMESSDALANDLNTTMNAMNQQKANLTLESEVVAYDNEEYQAAEKQTVFEIQKLNSEIKDLERQSRALTKGAERARIKAGIAAKRLQLKKREQSEAQFRMKKAEHQNSQVKAKVELTEQQLAQAKQKTRDAQNSIREIEKDNMKLKSRIKQIKKMIAEEKKRKDGLRSKRTKISEEGQRLRSQIAKLEKAS